MSDAPEYKFVTYETFDDGLIARILLNRPESRNAQNRGMLVELNDAFLAAEADDLAERTLEFARRIAQIPTMAALLIKESVNQTQDNMGFYNALHACFTMHELNHAQWSVVHDDGMAVAKLGEDVPDWRGTKLKLSERDTVVQVEANA